MTEKKVPVFCIADLPAATLNQFFQEANDAAARFEYDEPQGVLMTSKDLSDKQLPSAPPLSELRNSPFHGFSVDEVTKWSQHHLKNSKELTSHIVIILDERTSRDNTCTMAAYEPLPEETEVEWTKVRSDAESSLVCLMTIATGCGGVDSLDTRYKDFDGVFRMEAQMRADEESRSANPTGGQ